MSIVSIPTQNGFKFDWLTISFRDVSTILPEYFLYEICSLLCLDPNNFTESSFGGFPGYNRSFQYIESGLITISWHSERYLKQGILVNITGKGTLLFDYSSLYNYLKFCVEKNAYFTRVDVAFDDVEQVIPLSLIDEIRNRAEDCDGIYPNIGFSSKNLGSNIQIYTNVPNRSDLKNGRIKYHLGKNIVLGSRYSKCLVRLYNKAYEQRLFDLYWWRLELQLKYELAEAVVLSFLNKDIANSFVYFLNHYFRIIDFKSNSKTPDAVATHKRWEEFLTKLSQYVILLPKIRINGNIRISIDEVVSELKLKYQPIFLFDLSLIVNSYYYYLRNSKNFRYLESFYPDFFVDMKHLLERSDKALTESSSKLDFYQRTLEKVLSKF